MFRLFIAGIFTYMAFLSTREPNQGFWVICYAILTMTSLLWLYVKYYEDEPLI